MPKGTLLASLSLLLLASPAARAETARTPHRILAYGKVGGLIPVNDLGPHVTFRLGGGYAPPILRGRLAFVLDLGYVQSSTSKSFSDPRLGAAGGELGTTMTQRDLGLFLGPQVFILDPARRLVPYTAIGLDLHFVQSLVDGQGAGQSLGENREVSTEVGLAWRGGVGYRLGPGLITGELAFAWAPIDREITGDSHLGRFSILVGYTALFGL
jgi:hypothetical protein